jgi:hypothetical protein
MIGIILRTENEPTVKCRGWETPLAQCIQPGRDNVANDPGAIVPALGRMSLEQSAILPCAFPCDSVPLADCGVEGRLHNEPVRCEPRVQR